MTLAELREAIDGFNELRSHEMSEFMTAVRLVCFYVVAPHNKNIKRPTDVFELPIDKEMRKIRLKKMKPIQRIEGE